MPSATWRSIGLVLIPAILFGASFPISKTIVAQIPPLELAGLFYVFSGMGTALARMLLGPAGPEGRLRRGDGPWLLGSIFLGGVAGPVLLMYGLERTPAHISSLLASSETLFTVILAVAFFGDFLLKREILATLLMVAGATLVSMGGSDAGGRFDWQGPLCLLGAGLAWGFDNNFTMKLSGRDPLLLAAIKGFGAGPINLAIATLTGQLKLFPMKALIATALVGVFCYGMSFALFIVGLRRLGAARTAAIYATGPGFGVLISWLAFNEVPQPLVLAGGALMLPALLLFARSDPKSTSTVQGP